MEGQQPEQANQGSEDDKMTLREKRTENEQRIIDLSRELDKEYRIWKKTASIVMLNFGLM